MTETLKTFVGARMAVDLDREPGNDRTAEDGALVSLISGAGVTDPKGQAHFVEALRQHLLSSETDAKVPAKPGTAASADVISDSNSDKQPVDSSEQQDLSDHRQAVSGSQSSSETPQGTHAHLGIASHGRRAFLTDQADLGSHRPAQQEDASNQTGK